MFSFGEIALVVLIGLFVLGPERLPKLARSMGRYWKYANRYLEKIKAEINQAIEIDEIEASSTPAEKTDYTAEMNKALGIDTNPHKKDKG